ncbi:MAG: hypothetical protein DI533_06840 [Cereibacter sphaeroides]|uniref:SGNH/GDSL hydrolase family protein n=1 Tax=Cereibacter sphaeroides TaxID=1063 RepID=A0A2W5SHI9_CERSP|nr:MAG: hypothetical protein DI533_06840 [Cereibacter sphaeroides]
MLFISGAINSSQLGSCLDDRSGHLSKPLYLFRASRCDRACGSAHLRTAQTAVAAANPRIVAGMNTDNLGYDYRWDACHFNDEGRAAILAEVVPAIAMLIEATAPPEGGAVGTD